MPRRKKRKTPAALIKNIISVAICLAVLVGLFFFGKFLVSTAKDSDYFRVKSIIIDPELQFINKRDLSFLKGKNIFEVDLKNAQKKIMFKYPQVMHLKIIRELPNQLHLEAKKRQPALQAIFNKRVVTVDNKGVVLSTTTGKNKKLAFVEGFKGVSRDIMVGEAIKGDRMSSTLKIIRIFGDNKNLKEYSIDRIDVDNLSKITVYLEEGFNVILDRSSLNEKISMLGVVLTQGQIDMKTVKYLDLRFKEPIIGKK